VKELSGSQVDKLGRRLRNAKTPSLEDLRLLERVRRTYEDARLEVVQTLLAEGLEGTSRLKTTSTIIEKLRRQSTMHLSRMQDIAGVRLVIDGGRLDQDRVVERICGLFPDARMVDRREKPSYGYRAVHVIVRTRGCLVEVQVRTYLQDMWAQIVERLADLFGRQIRYGEPPTNPDVEIAPGAPGWTRQSVVDLFMPWSKEVDRVETAAALLAELERRAETSADVAARLAGMSEFRARLDHAERRLRDALEPLHAALQPATVDDAGDQT
jgi:hypothetical protein